MIIWVIAILLVTLVGIFGYTQGAIRVLISTAGLLLGALLAAPLAPLLYPCFKAGGVLNPLIPWVLSPLIIILIAIFLSLFIGETVNRKVDAYYKYKVPDMKRTLWERMNGRLGICFSVLNATIYLIIFSVYVYVLAYPAYQLSSGESDSRSLRFLIQAAEGLKSTGMDKVAAAFDPAPKKYYVVSDVVGLLYRNPLAAGAAARYPALLGMCDRADFQDMMNDKAFYEHFAAQPPIQKLYSDTRIQTLLNNPEVVSTLLKLDFKDFTNYLATGRSDKFGDERILGRWTFDLNDTLAQCKRAKPTMTQREMLLLRRGYTTNFTKATLVGYIDNRVAVKVTQANNSIQSFLGSWKSAEGGKYQLTWNSGNFSPDVEAEPDRLLLKKDGRIMVFGPEM